MTIIILSGILISLIAGPIGCFLVWRRLAFFGDTVAHSSLLGIALGTILGIDPYISITSFIILISLALGVLNRQTRINSETQLVLISQGTLALGLMILAFFPRLQGDINSLLFGDLLALSTRDFIYSIMLTIITLVVVKTYWRQFVCWTVSEDVAAIEGQNVTKIRFIFFTLVGLFVAIAAKAVGVILMTALLIIPAASARLISRSPSQMIIYASLINIIAFSLGFGLSYLIDVPVTAAIVVSGIGLFIGLTVMRKFQWFRLLPA